MRRWIAVLITAMVFIGTIAAAISAPALVSVTLERTRDDALRLYFNLGHGFDESRSPRKRLRGKAAAQTLYFWLPKEPIQQLRVDPSMKAGESYITRLCLLRIGKRRCWGARDLAEQFHPYGIADMRIDGETLVLRSLRGDPYLVHRRFAVEQAAFLEHPRRTSLPLATLIAGIAAALSYLFLRHSRHIAKAVLGAAGRCAAGAASYSALFMTLAALSPIAVWAITAWLLRTDLDLFMRLAREDAALEYAQALCFGLSGVLAIGLAAHFLQGRQLGWALLYGLGGLALVFVTGEEVSWGQRIIGFDTPVALHDQNRQGEFNVHNIRGVGQAFAFAIYAASIAGAVASLGGWIAGRRRLTRFGLYRVLPHPVLLPGILSPVFYSHLRGQISARATFIDGLPLIAENLTGRQTHGVASRLQEPMELVLSMTVLMFLVAVTYHEFRGTARH